MWNTLDSYGENGSSGFIGESEMPQVTDSKYKRHEVGGESVDKETKKDTGVISQCQN